MAVIFLSRRDEETPTQYKKRLCFGVLWLILGIYAVAAFGIQMSATAGLYSIRLSTFCEAWSGSREFRSNFTAGEMSINNIEEMCAYSQSNPAPNMPFWRMPNADFLIRFVDCQDRLDQVMAFLRSPAGQESTGIEWNEDKFADARGKLSVDCYASKANFAEVLGAAPIMQFFTLVFFIVASFRPRQGLHFFVVALAAAALALSFVALWAISFALSGLWSRFSLCSNAMHLQKAEQPGTLWNGESCIDVNSEGEVSNNPFVLIIAIATGSYTESCVGTIIVNLILLAATCRRISLAGEGPKAPHQSLADQTGSANDDDQL